MPKQRKLLLPRVVHSFSAPIPTKEFKTVSKTSFNGRIGVFAGKVGDNTAAVDVIERRTHKKYGRVFSRIRRCKVHVEQNVLVSLQRGDKVVMHASRPLSKTKKLSFHPEKDRLQGLRGLSSRRRENQESKELYLADVSLDGVPSRPIGTHHSSTDTYFE